MSVVSTFTPDQNFWEANPQLELVPEFKALKKADRSRGKEESSLTMWWVAFCYDLDPDNRLRGQPLAENQRMLGAEMLGNPTFFEDNRKKLEPLIERYLQLTDSEAKRALRDWEDKLKERRAFLKEVKYTMGEIGEKGNWVGGTATQLDSMLANSKKLFDEYKVVLKDIAEQAGDGHVQGGSKESLSDSGEI